MSTYLPSEAIRKAAEELVKKQQRKPDDHRRLKTGYVLMLDVLGFKDFVSKDSGENFFSIWFVIRERLLSKKAELEEKHKSLEIDVLCLSDTLIICVSMKGNPKTDPRFLLILIPMLIDTFFIDMFESKIFFRGAISFGNFRCDMNLNIAMGNALDEAYEWHETTDWIGIIMTPSANFAMEKILLDTADNDAILSEVRGRFVQYSIPFKIANIFLTRAFVWWNIPPEEKDKLKRLSNILGTLSSIMLSPSIVNKYQNTINFIINQMKFDMQIAKKQRFKDTELLGPEQPLTSSNQIKSSHPLRKPI